MCGITGYWSSNKLTPQDSQYLEQMTHTLYHRGPDGYGYHIDLEKGLAMGHARLTIIDFESGKQPLHGINNENVLTVNGEFYDYKRIRTELNLEGYRFKTKSDSEIALPLYEKYGLDFVQHLRGEYAFSFYDAKEDQLIMVRDRFGVKPMFYHIGENCVYWGSEIKSLFAHPDVPKKFSHKSVLHQLMHTMVPGTSAFEDIHALKPGHMMIIKKKPEGGYDIKDIKYWDINFPKEDERDMSKSAEYHIKQTQEKLSEAVQLRLEADVPVGCYLSGGIDSCSMLGLASSMQQAPVKAFTISFDNKDYDEAHIAKEMADEVRAEQEQIELSAAELYGENYIKTLWHSERTFYNTLGVAKYCMSKRVNECDYRVVVTGEGSDELFGGYPFFKRDMLRLGMDGHSEEDVENYKQLMEESNKLFKGAILSEEQMTHPKFEEVCGYTPSWIQPWMNTLELARPLLKDEILEELEEYDPLEAIAETFDKDQLDGRHVLDKAQYTWIKTMLECQILNWGGDRVDMANSMESRPAFLDHKVAEMARNIPPHLRIKGNTEKWVLREAMKNVLPEVLYKREKFAFMAPPGHTEEKKRLAIEKLIDTYMNEEKIINVGLFDVDRLTTFLHEYRNDDDPVSLVRKDALLNHLIGLHILHDLFIKETVLN